MKAKHATSPVMHATNIGTAQWLHSAADWCTSCCHGILTYHLKHSLLRPRVWIMESSNPLAAATMATPMQDEWPLYPEGSKSKPTVSRVLFVSAASLSRFKGEPSANTNKGPGVAPRIKRKAIMAATGHRASLHGAADIEANTLP